MKSFTGFALLICLLYGCRKQQASGADQTVSGHLRYYSIAYDGPGLYYQEDISADPKDSAAAAPGVLLLSDGHDGYIVDGEGVEAHYHNYIGKHTTIRYRDTGRKGCTSSSIANYQCPNNIHVIDVTGFTVIPE